MDTQLLGAHETVRAAKLLRAGGLVGLPTETVYGLGADGLNARAVEGIFTAKGRPQDNPLILHIPDADWLSRCCREVPPAALLLAERFWPGPLTLVLRRREDIPLAVTAGLDTVAVRCPDHPVCREVIRRAGTPIAAPSGNLSGRPSPTTAQAMLADLAGRIDAVVDGGPCKVGVESTILDLTVTPPRLLRPGGVPLEALEAVLGEVHADPAVSRPMEAGERPRAPGMKYRHYAPRAPVTVVAGPPEASADYISRHIAPADGVLCFDEYALRFCHHPLRLLGPREDAEEQARRLFEALRAFDDTDARRIWTQCPAPTGLGLAVVNRLYKAAGFQVVEVEP